MAELDLQKLMAEATQQRSSITTALLAIQKSLDRMQPTVTKREPVLASLEPAINELPAWRPGVDTAAGKLQTNTGDILAHLAKIATRSFPTGSSSTMLPTTCSTGFPSRDASASVSALTSPAAPSSFTSTNDVVSELAAPVVSDEALVVEASVVAALTPTRCSTSGLDHKTDKDDSKALCLLPWSVPTLFTIPQEASPPQSFQLFIAIELDIKAPTRCSTMCFTEDTTVCTYLFMADVTQSSRRQRQMLRPIPWPSFTCHSRVGHPIKPCSATQALRWALQLAASSHIPVTLGSMQDNFHLPLPFCLQFVQQINADFEAPLCWERHRGIFQHGVAPSLPRTDLLQENLNENPKYSVRITCESGYKLLHTSLLLLQISAVCVFPCCSVQFQWKVAWLFYHLSNHCSVALVRLPMPANYFTSIWIYAVHKEVLIMRLSTKLYCCNTTKSEGMKGNLSSSPYGIIINDLCNSRVTWCLDHVFSRIKNMWLQRLQLVDANFGASIWIVQHNMEHYRQVYFIYSVGKLLSSSSAYVLHLADFWEADSQLKCKGRSQCLIGEVLVDVLIRKGGHILCFLGKFIEEKPLNNCAAANLATSWTEIKPRSQVCVVLVSGMNNDFYLERLWDPGDLIQPVWNYQFVWVNFVRVVSLEWNSFVLVATHNAAVLWLVSLYALSNTTLLLPWDPVVSWYGMCTHFQAVKILHWVVSLLELQPWPFWEASSSVPIVVRTVSDNCHEIVKLQMVIREGTLILQGDCSKVELRPLLWPPFECSGQMFISSKERAVRLIKRPLFILQSDASIMLMEGLPRPNAHLTVKMLDAAHVDTSLVYFLGGVQYNCEKLSLAPLYFCEQLHWRIAWLISVQVIAFISEWSCSLHPEQLWSASYTWFESTWSLHQLRMLLGCMNTWLVWLFGQQSNAGPVGWPRPDQDLQTQRSFGGYISLISFSRWLTVITNSIGMVLGLPFHFRNSMELRLFEMVLAIRLIVPWNIGDRSSSHGQSKFQGGSCVMLMPIYLNQVSAGHKYYFDFDEVRADIFKQGYHLRHTKDHRVSWGPGGMGMVSAWGQAEFQGGRNVM